MGNKNDHYYSKNGNKNKGNNGKGKTLDLNRHEFVNKYNFVPFGSAVEQIRTSREATYRNPETKLLSGWLNCLLQTKTPLIIPDGAHPLYWDIEKNKYVKNPTKEEKKILHKVYGFQHVPDGDKNVPIIPGSSLHGMLRSVYETVTDSCVALLRDEDTPISQRIPTYVSLQKRGLLSYEPKKDDPDEWVWVLYNTVSDREAVRVDRGKIYDMYGDQLTYQNGSFVQGKGWLQYNFPVNGRNYHIAYLNPKEVVYTWDFKDENGKPDVERNWEPYKALKSVLDRDGVKIKNPNQVPFSNLKKALEKAKNAKNSENKNVCMVPVYYFDVERDGEKLIYLSNSSIGRIAQRRRLREIMGEHAPCMDTNKLCPACLLFGTVKGNGLKGRIRVTDGTLTCEPEMEPHTLQILGEPRTSAFEFYLRKPEGTKATYWNFDFYGYKVKESNGRETTKYVDLGKSTPRGRKMYWHGPVAPDIAKDKMNATMDALNGSFEFKVYFDNITEEQLNKLMWVITLGENDEESHRQHKLGHARPLGYGSVKLMIKDKVVRTITTDGDHLAVKLDTSVIGDEIRDVFSEDDEIVKNLLRMCDANAISKDIPLIYPWDTDNKGNEAIYIWFANNRRNAGYLKTLPEPLVDGTKKKMLSGSWADTSDPFSGVTKKAEKNTGSKSSIVLSGKVKFYNKTKDFGYIIAENGKEYGICLNRNDNPDVSENDLTKDKAVTFGIKKLKNGKEVAINCKAK